MIPQRKPSLMGWPQVTTMHHPFVAQEALQGELEDDYKEVFFFFQNSDVRLNPFVLHTCQWFINVRRLHRWVDRKLRQCITRLMPKKPYERCKRQVRKPLEDDFNEFLDFLQNFDSKQGFIDFFANWRPMNGYMKFQKFDSRWGFIVFFCFDVEIVFRTFCIFQGKHSIFEKVGDSDPKRTPQSSRARVRFSRNWTDLLTILKPDSWA